jgi:hypothetical protein
MYMIASLGVGGYWPGNPDGTTQFPADMQIDYLRAYKPDPPTIAGTSAGLATGIYKAVSPFASVTLTDPGASSITATVTPSSTASGILSDPLAASDGSRIANGVYTVSGTLVQVQAALQGLVFTPNSGHTPGSTVTTSFTIGLDDGHGGAASDSTTSVVVTAPPPSRRFLRG